MGSLHMLAINSSLRSTNHNLGKQVVAFHTNPLEEVDILRTLAAVDSNNAMVVDDDVHHCHLRLHHLFFGLHWLD